jgi:hypothetical protein
MTDEMNKVCATPLTFIFGVKEISNSGSRTRRLNKANIRARRSQFQQPLFQQLPPSLLDQLVEGSIKGKAIPVTGRGGPQACETSRLPCFL